MVENALISSPESKLGNILPKEQTRESNTFLKPGKGQEDGRQKDNYSKKKVNLISFPRHARGSDAQNE